MLDFSLRDILKLIIDGGAVVAMVVIWYLTFKSAIEQNKAANNTAACALERADATAREAFQKHMALSGELVQLLKDEQEYKTTLTGILDRISYRLETPAQCPILMPGRKVKMEVTE